MWDSRIRLPLATAAVLCLTVGPTITTADDCRAVTWVNKRDLEVTRPTTALGVVASPRFTPNIFVRDNSSGASLQAGELNCRYYGTTESFVNYYTCTLMAQTYGISTETFFSLNPNVQPDCSNLQPNTDYCVWGYPQPLVATDGLCGPPHGNASCYLQYTPCCNSDTWTCGNSTDDCADGTCWGGACLGHTVYTTDGACGFANGDRLCAGKWGDCCSMQGECGTGPDFCGDGYCQSGNCTTPIGPVVSGSPNATTTSASSRTNSTLSSTTSTSSSSGSVLTTSTTTSVSSPLGTSSVTSVSAQTSSSSTLPLSSSLSSVTCSTEGWTTHTATAEWPPLPIWTPITTIHHSQDCQAFPHGWADSRLCSSRTEIP